MFHGQEIPKPVRENFRLILNIDETFIIFKIVFAFPYLPNVGNVCLPTQREQHKIDTHTHTYTH